MILAAQLTTSGFSMLIQSDMRLNLGNPVEGKDSSGRQNIHIKVVRVTIYITGGVSRACLQVIQEPSHIYTLMLSSMTI